MYLPATDTASLLAALRATPCAAGDGLLVLIAEATRIDLDALAQGLGSLPVPAVAARFPQVLAEGAAHAVGAAVATVPLAGAPVVARRGDEGTLIGLPADDLLDVQSALVFVDGLAPDVAWLLSELYAAMGGGCSFVGGGAGSLSLQQAPCLVTPAGAVQDAALVIPLRATLGVGVRHGWTHLAGPFLATRTNGTHIEELNWQPAAAVYRSVVEPTAQVSVEPEGFFQVAKGFPFGMQRPEGEPVVRDPIALRGDTLICVGEVPENTAMSVLRGEAGQLIAAAAEAAQASVAPSRAPSLALLVDCISRSIFLEDRFGEELDAIHQALAPRIEQVVGALTLGEIANPGDHLLEFFNKTCVVATVDREAP